MNIVVGVSAMLCAIVAGVALGGWAVRYRALETGKDPMFSLDTAVSRYNLRQDMQWRAMLSAVLYCTAAGLALTVSADVFWMTFPVTLFAALPQIITHLSQESQ